MDRYDPARELTPDFIARVRSWIAATGEVFIVLRYLRAAGGKDYVLCRSSEGFDALVAPLLIGTDIIVFQQPQLPIRGISSPEFIAHCIAQIPDDADYVVARMHRPDQSQFYVSGRLGSGHDSLREDLADFCDQSIAVGLCPDFNVPDNDRMISASKGGIDGPR